MLDISKAEMSLKCPKCEAEVKFTLSQVGESVKCAECGILINLQDDGSVRKAQQTVNDSLNDLAKSIKDVNVKLRI